MLKKAAICFGILLTAAPIEAARYLSADIRTAGFAWDVIEPQSEDDPWIEEDWIQHTDYQFTVNLDELQTYGSTYFAVPGSDIAVVYLSSYGLSVYREDGQYGTSTQANLPYGIIDLSETNAKNYYNVGSFSTDYVYEGRYGLYRTITGPINYANVRVFDSDTPIQESLVVREYQTGVPEPASWAMMLAGFGLVGGALRSRRKVAVGMA